MKILPNKIYAGLTDKYEPKHNFYPGDCLAVIDCSHLDWKCFMTLRYNEGAAQPYVTHWFNAEDGGYFYGHYFSDYESALSDLVERVKPKKIREMREMLSDCNRLWVDLQNSIDDHGITLEGEVLSFAQNVDEQMQKVRDYFGGIV